MLENYLKIAWRNLNRQKIYSLLNISGLAIGMAGFILIMLYVSDELSYDNFHEHADDTYRIAFGARLMNDYLDVAVSAGPLAPALEASFPEVEDATRIEAENESVLIAFGDKKFYEDKLIFADTGFFNIFSFRMLQGNPHTALNRKYTMVLTQSTAHKYFGDQNPVGKVIRYNEHYNFMVTGVVEDPPPNSHMHFNLMASFATLEDFPFSDRLNMWGSLNFLTYVRLTPGTAPERIRDKLPEFIASKMGTSVDTLAANGMVFKPHFQNIRDIHLHSHLLGELEPNNDINNIYIFSAVAFFILIIACINFVNLSTARSAKRAKEVGLRKTLGADRSDLIIQFLGETLLLSFIAMLIALLLIEFMLPSFNDLTQKDLSLFHGNSRLLLLLLGFFAVLIGVVSGIYPAFYLSAFRPVSVLKGHLGNNGRRPVFRNVLVVVQFFISVVLLISTTLIIRQYRHMRNLDLGFDTRQVVVVPLRDIEGSSPKSAIKNAFAMLPEVESVSTGSNYPGTQAGKWGCSPEDAEGNLQWVVGIISVDNGYFETLGMDVIDGRSFRAEETSEAHRILINEALARKAGWKHPVGKHIYVGDNNPENKFTIIGLVKDAHFSSVKDPVEPNIYMLSEERTNKLLIRLAAGDTKSSLTKLEKTWTKLEPARPFDYFFLDQSFSMLYQNEQRLSRLFSWFTVLALIVACIGLFGLSSFMAEQRTREIGIRKVFGASARNIVFHLVSNFVMLVLLANALAWPVAYVFMAGWLENFTYATSFGFGVFVITGTLSLAIAVITVLFIAIRASRGNTAESLRWE